MFHSMLDRSSPTNQELEVCAQVRASTRTSLSVQACRLTGVWACVWTCGRREVSRKPELINAGVLQHLVVDYVTYYYIAAMCCISYDRSVCTCGTEACIVFRISTCARMSTDMCVDMCTNMFAGAHMWHEYMQSMSVVMHTDTQTWINAEDGHACRHEYSRASNTRALDAARPLARSLI